MITQLILDIKCHNMMIIKNCITEISINVLSITEPQKYQCLEIILKH